MRNWTAAALVIVLISGVSIYAAWVFTEPPNNSINVEVDSSGGFLQNLTVSCYGCAPDSEYIWQGKVAIGNTSFTLSATKPNSTAIELLFAEGIPRIPNSTCASGFQTNSTCVYPLGPLPFSINFNIRKTSTGGILRAVLYLTNGNYFPFETTSGNLTQTFNFKQE